MAKLPKHLLKILVAFIVLAIMCHFFFKTYTTENFYKKQTVDEAKKKEDEKKMQTSFVRSFDASTPRVKPERNTPGSR